MNMDSAHIKRGFVFEHKRRITNTGAPEKYRVTKRDDYLIYYRPINDDGEYIGTPWKSKLEFFVSDVLGKAL